MTISTMKKAANEYPGDALPPFDMLLEMDGGFEALLLFTKCFSGNNVYIPALRTILRDCLKNCATLEYNGANAIRLAAKYGYTTKYFKRMLNERPKTQARAS